MAHSHSDVASEIASEDDNAMNSEEVRLIVRVCVCGIGCESAELMIFINFLRYLPILGMVFCAGCY